MGLLLLLRTFVARRKQRSLLQAIDDSPVRYSDSPGISLDNPVVITGAGHDLAGTLAIFVWLIRKRGTMNIDWQIRDKRGSYDGQRHVDIYTIQSRSGVEETFYFDITESFGKFSS